MKILTALLITAALRAAPLAYYPITPCRVADTRTATGPLGGPALTGGQSRTFPILASTCNLPATAQAYSLNFAAIPSGSLGYLTAWPMGQPQPPTATLNGKSGEVTSNGAIVAAGVGGAINVFASDNTHLVIDINGYFAPLDLSGLVGPVGPVGPQGPQGVPGPQGVSGTGSGSIPACEDRVGIAGSVLYSLGNDADGNPQYLSLGPLAQGAYSVTACLNDSAVPRTIASIRCFTDEPQIAGGANGAANTLQVESARDWFAQPSVGPWAWLTAAPVACGQTWPAGALAASPTLAPGDSLVLVFQTDGVSNQVGWRVTWQ